MTEAQKRFCNEYLIDLNASRAYKIAYPKTKKEETINSASSRMLRNVKVQEYISKKMKEREKRTEITQDMVIEELASIAFFNIKNIYKEDGTLKNISNIDDKSVKGIAGIKILQKAGSMKIEINPDGKDKEIPIEHIPEQTIEIKMNDKVKALELLGKHLGMFNDVNINMKNAIQVELVDDVNE